MSHAQKSQGVLYKNDPDGLLFLLLKRSEFEGDYWQPLTGSVEENETELECLERELFEEIGLLAQDVKVGPVLYEFSWSRDGVTYSEFVRSVQIAKDAKITISSEHTEYKWCTLEESLNLLKHESNKQGYIILAKELVKENLK